MFLWAGQGEQRCFWWNLSLRAGRRGREVHSHRSELLPYGGRIPGCPLEKWAGRSGPSPPPTQHPQEFPGVKLSDPQCRWSVTMNKLKSFLLKPSLPGLVGPLVPRGLGRRHTPCHWEAGAGRGLKEQEGQEGGGCEMWFDISMVLHNLRWLKRE